MGYGHGFFRGAWFERDDDSEGGQHRWKHRHGDGRDRNEEGRRFAGGRGGRGFDHEGPGGPFGGPFGGPGGHGGHGGPGGRVRRGAARFVVLDALKDGPKHGYEIIRAIAERSGRRYAPSPGLIYPTLQMLEDLGLVRAEADGERRVYRLTEAGETELTSHAEELRAFWERFAPTSGSQTGRAEMSFLQDELNDLFRTIQNGLHTTGHDAETVRRVRQTVTQCKENVRRIIAGIPGETSEGEEA